MNLSKNYFRRRSIERSYLARETALAPRPLKEPDPVAREGMRQALMTLPARQRAAIVLRYYEDLPDSQIAEILRCRPGTVRSLLTRGVQTLRMSVRGDSRDD